MADQPDPTPEAPGQDYAGEYRFLKALLAIGASTLFVAIAVGIIAAVAGLTSDLSLIVLTTLFTAGGIWAYILFPAIRR